MRNTLFAAAAAIFFTCCGGTSRPPIPPEILKSSASEASEGDRRTRKLFVDRLVRRAKTKKKLELLLLSVGGQHGAYGMGFLRGWKDREDFPMPEFDLVTGSSTGALQAPFAFVGTPQVLKKGADLYRNAATEVAPSFNYLFWFERTGAVYDTTKLGATVDTFFDESMKTGLTRAFEDGRTLAIATTDLNLGIGRTWDIESELRNPSSGRERAKSILLASSSIPALFPPVYLDGHLHSDGGMVTNLLFPLELSDLVAIRDQLDAAGDSAPLDIRITAIFNMWTKPPLQTTTADRPRAILARAPMVSLCARQMEGVERLELLAQAASSSIPRLSVSFQFTSIPNELLETPPDKLLFDEAWMKKLEQRGYELGKNGSGFGKRVNTRERN